MNQLLLMVSIADRNVAISADKVHSVIELDEITPVPHAPSHVVGIAALRSRAMTVIDCRRVLGLPDRKSDQPHEKAVAIRHENFLYALLVDAIEDVTDARSEPTPLQGKSADQWTKVALGMIETDGGPAVLVDVAALIDTPVEKAA